MMISRSEVTHMVNLRSYQEEAVNAVLSSWRDGHRRTLIALATGTGKTVCFSEIIKRTYQPGTHALVLAHRSELLSQAEDKLENVSGLSSALEKADSHAYGSPEPVVLGSVQTLSNEKRLEEYPADYFSRIVVDEAHHTMSDSYLKVLNHFPEAKVLGVTATPSRSDKKNLADYYENIAYEYNMRDAIRDGWLCPIKAQMIPLQVDISKVSISNGDYSASELGSVLDPYLDMIAIEMKKYAKGRKTVVFLPLVVTSQKFCRVLQKQGFKAAEVNGESTDREEILRSFEKGEIEVLCNSMLLTEGWDCPSVDCIVCLRPTKIRSLYQQILGRGTRLAPDKKELLVLDFLWLTTRHDLCGPSTLLGQTPEMEDKIRKKIEGGGLVDLLEAEEEIERDAVKERENSLRKELLKMRQKKSMLVDPLQFAVSLSDEALLSYEPTFMWEKEPATDEQLEALKRYGIAIDNIMNKGHAAAIISRLKRRMALGLSTPKQIRTLERYNFRHVGEWRKDDASAVISRISSNNWKLPHGLIPETYNPKIGGRI